MRTIAESKFIGKHDYKLINKIVEKTDLDDNCQELNFDELYRNIKELFNKYQYNNKIKFNYHTKIVIGSLN